jgi:hypothetical protein
MAWLTPLLVLPSRTSPSTSSAPQCTCARSAELLSMVMMMRSACCCGSRDGLAEPGPLARLASAGSMTELDFPDHSVAGVLSWYSTIHLTPSALDGVLTEFRRILAPAGVLVAGFFDSDDVVAEFAHKVVAAYRSAGRSMCSQAASRGPVLRRLSAYGGRCRNGLTAGTPRSRHERLDPGSLAHRDMSGRSATPFRRPGGVRRMHATTLTVAPHATARDPLVAPSTRRVAHACVTGLRHSAGAKRSRSEARQPMRQYNRLWVDEERQQRPCGIAASRGRSGA